MRHILLAFCVDGCNAIAGDRHFTEMAATRDREIVAVLKAIRDARAV